MCCLVSDKRVDNDFLLQIFLTVLEQTEKNCRKNISEKGRERERKWGVFDREIDFYGLSNLYGFFKSKTYVRLSECFLFRE